MRSLIAYIALLSVQVPFNIAYFLTYLSTDRDATGMYFGAGYLIIAGVYFAALGVLGIVNILRSFRAYKAGDVEYCIKGLMTLKYGMVPFFIVNFLSMTALILLFLVASRGTVFFAVPGLLVVAMFCTWLPMLPSSFFGLQVVRFCADEGKLGKSKPWHILFQFCFLLDVLDTAYLTVFKYQRGKAAAAVVCAVYALFILLVCVLLARAL